MHAAQEIPSWVPSAFRAVLPGGDEWDADGEAGHPLLAIRISRLAFGEIKFTHDADGVPLWRRDAFLGGLVIRRDEPSALVPPGVPLVLHRREVDQSVIDALTLGESALVVHADDRLAPIAAADGPAAYKLPVRDTYRFNRFVWEATLHLAPPRE